MGGPCHSIFSVGLYCWFMFPSSSVFSVVNRSRYFDMYRTLFAYTGGVKFIWCVIWHFSIFDTPDENPYISEEEKHYIKSDGAADKSHMVMIVRNIHGARAIIGIQS